jgi:hypothetical protein
LFFGRTDAKSASPIAAALSISGQTTTWTWWMRSYCCFGLSAFSRDWFKHRKGQLIPNDASIDTGSIAFDARRRSLQRFGDDKKPC